MSPEQVVGGPIDARADVFAVGIVLYEMLSGRRPFPGSTNPEILRALMFTEPVPLRSLVPDVPEPLAEIAHHCLQKNVEHRFKDATVVAARLRVPQKTTDGPIAKDVIRRPARRHALTAALGLLLGATAIAGFLWTPSRKDAATSSTASVVNVAETLKQAEGYLQRFDKKGNSDRAIATLEPSIQLNGSSPSLSATLAEAYVRKFTETSDKKWLSKAIDTARGAVADNEDLASAHVALGQALAASGQTAEALQEFTRARDLNPLSGPAHLGLAGLQSKSRDAEDLFLKAVQYSPDEWLPLSSLAVFYYREARYDESVAKWREALQLAPDNTRVMVNLAAGFHMLGQYSLAADILQRALALDDTAASTWANLSTARYFQGNFREGVRAAEKAVELAPGKYLYWGNLGDSYRWVEESRGKAHSAYENAIRLVRDQLALTPNDSNLRSSLAVYLAKSGDTAAATMELTKLADLASGDRGTLFKTALTYELLHDRNHALAALERAIAAKYSMHEIANEPELAALRSDARYSRIAR
jgi:serine/threonine-protein kinase